MLTVIAIPALKDNYIWCVYNKESRQCLIIDPGEAKPVYKTIDKLGLSPLALLVTHHHWDHCGGVGELCRSYAIPVYARRPDVMGGHSKPIHDGDRLDFTTLKLSLKAMAVPGHTLDHTAFFGAGMVFTGDTLFTGGCGKFFEGSPQQMHHSLKELAQLPSETLVYCGHEYTRNNLIFAQTVEPHNEAINARVQQVETCLAQGHPTVPATLANELKTNPFLRTHEPSVRNAAERYAGQTLTDEIAVLATLRQWKNREV